MVNSVHVVPYQEKSCMPPLPFRWSVQLPNGEVDVGGPYSISPEAGEVEPGSSASITVRLSPQEVDDCSRVLVADIAHLDPACQQLRRPLSGAHTPPNTPASASMTEQ